MLRTCQSPLPQPPPIQTPILDRLAHVLRLEVRRPLEVGEGAGDLENPMIRPRGQRAPGPRAPARPWSASARISPTAVVAPRTNSCILEHNSDAMNPGA